jgi:putative PEP-CTERM system TPR-repeat lipoprotein
MNVAYSETTDKLYEDGLKAFNDKDYGKSIVILKNAMFQDSKHLSSRILLGRAFFLSYNFYEAEHQFQQAITDGADKGQIFIPLGQTLLLQGKYDALLNTISEGEVHPDNEAEILALRARSYLELNQYEQARKTYERIILTHPQDSSGYIGKAILELKLGNLSGAENWINKGLELDGGNADALQLKGDLIYRTGDLSLAKQYLLQSLAINERSFRTRLLLTEIYIAESKMDKALEHITFVMELEPDYPNVNLLYAFVLVKLDRKNDALKISQNISTYLSKINDLDLNKYPSLRLILGISLYMQESWESAYGHLNFYAEEFPGHEQSHLMLANLDIRFERFNNALKVLKHYNGESKRLEYFLLNLTSMVKLSKQHEALILVDEALEQYPKKIQLLEFKIKLLIAKNDLPNALLLLEELYETGNATDELALLLGQLQLGVTELDKAELVVDQLLLSKPEHPVYLSLSAGIDLQKGQLDKAKYKLEKAIKLSPNILQLYVNLHYVYLEQREFKLASNILIQAYKISPTNAFLLEKLASLAEQIHNLNIAKTWREKLYQLQPNDLHNLVRLADALLKLKKSDEALELLLVHRKDYRLEPEFLSRLAATFVELKQCIDATPLLRMLFDLSLRTPEQLMLIAEMHMKCGSFESAHRVISTAESQQPTNTHIMITRGQWLFYINQPKLALKLIKPLAKKNDMRALQLEAEIYDSLEQYSKAIKSINKLYKNYPYPINAYKLFNLLKKNNQIEKGFLVLENYLKENNSVNIRRTLAREYSKAELFDKAESHYYLLASKNKDAEAYRNLAVIKSRHDIKKALVLAKQAYEMKPNSLAIVATYGWLLVQSGQAEQGLSHLRYAHARDGRQPTLLYRLGETLLILNQPAQAKEFFEQAIKYDFPAKDKAIEQLNKL